jgi:hypothetical protein
MALTVRETKAGARPGSGYTTSYPTKGSHPLTFGNSTISKRKTLIPGIRTTGQLAGKRGTQDPSLHLKQRTIV